MGSCFSKDVAEVKPATERVTRRTKGGQTLGGDSEKDPSKEAAAKAAELRQKQHQDQLENSKVKLKQLEKVSRKDKGLA